MHLLLTDIYFTNCIGASSPCNTNFVSEKYSANIYFYANTAERGITLILAYCWYVFCLIVYYFINIQNIEINTQKYFKTIKYHGHLDK